MIRQLCDILTVASLAAGLLLGMMSPSFELAPEPTAASVISPTTMLRAAPSSALVTAPSAPKVTEPEPLPRTTVQYAEPADWVVANSQSGEPETQTPARHGLSVSELIAEIFPYNAEAAYQIMMCESGGDPLAHGDLDLPARYTDGLGSLGLFQINGGNVWGKNVLAGLERWQTQDRDEVSRMLFDPATNIEIAHTIWETSGRRFDIHWRNCSRSTGMT